MSEGNPGGASTGDLLVVVVAFGPCELLETALAALGNGYPVSVVDNSSSSGTRAVAERLGATYIDPGRNVGFAAGVNRALEGRRSGTDVLLLNPDAAIDAENLERLRAALRADPEAGCVAPAQHAPGSPDLDRVCWPFPSPSRAWLEAAGLARLSARCDFVIGAVLLLRSAAIDDVGPLDEGYFLYAEETDWQLRARRRGWTALYCPEAHAEHVGGGTGGDPLLRERLFCASYERFMRKWYGPAGWQLSRVAQILGAGARALARRGPDGVAAARRGALYWTGPIAALGGGPASPRQSQPGNPNGVANNGTRPLRVAHVVCTDAFAGVERYIVSASKGLAGLGCEVVVIGGARDQMPQELTAAGVRWYPGPSVPTAAARLLTLGRFDVVHAHMTKAEVVSGIGMLRNGARIVATCHFAQRRGSSGFGRLVGRLTSRMLAEQLAISEYVRAAIDGHAVVVMPGVEEVADPSPPDHRDRTVLMVQRLEAEKRVEVGIEAFVRSGLARSGWRLKIAGSGTAEAALHQHAADLEVSSSVDFVGRVADVDALYREASIFLASRPDEPYGISVVEAMAHALPVVAAGAGGHLETVGKCQGAALFAPGDAAEAAVLLEALASNADRRAEYGAALRELQQQRFSVVRQVRETLEIYRGLLA